MVIQCKTDGLSKIGILSELASAKQVFMPSTLK